MAAMRALPASAQCPSKCALLTCDHLERLAQRALVTMRERLASCRNPRCDCIGERSRELFGQRLAILTNRELRADQRELEPGTGLRFELAERRQYPLGHRTDGLLRWHQW